MNQILKMYEEFDNIEQVLGKALGYPWYKDDQKNFPGATEEDGVCVGGHVAYTIAAEAASRIKSLEEKLEKQNLRVVSFYDSWSLADEKVEYLQKEVRELRSLLWQAGVFKDQKGV